MSGLTSNETGYKGVPYLKKWTVTVWRPWFSFPFPTQSLALWFARKPLWPFRPVKYGKFDLGLVAFLVSTAMTIRTMVESHHARHFVLIAIGNLSMSK